MSGRRASEITKTSEKSTPDRKRKAQDQPEKPTPKKIRASLAETPRTRIYRSRSVKDTAKTPEKEKGTKSVPTTPKSGDKKRKREIKEENVFQSPHFDSESEYSRAESDDEEELRRKKKIRKVEKKQDIAMNPDREEPILPTSAKKSGTKLFIDPSLLSKTFNDNNANNTNNIPSPLKDFIPTVTSPLEIRKTLSEVKSKRKSVEIQPEREPFRFVPETHSNQSDPMQVEEEKDESSVSANTNDNSFHYERPPFTLAPTPAIVLQRNNETINNTNNISNNNVTYRKNDVSEDNNNNGHVDFFNNHATPSFPPKSPANPFRELAELESRVGSHTAIFGTDQSDDNNSDRSNFTTQSGSNTSSANPFLPRVQSTLPVVKPLTQTQPAKVLWNREYDAESRPNAGVSAGQQHQVPARPTLQHRRISIMPNENNVVSTNFGIDEVQPEEDPTTKIHIPKKQPSRVRPATIIGFLLLGLVVGAMAYYIVNFVEIKQNEAVLSRMVKILRQQHGLAVCGESFSPALKGYEIISRYNTDYGIIDDKKAEMFLEQLTQNTDVTLIGDPSMSNDNPRVWSFKHEQPLKPWECVIREFVAENRTSIVIVIVSIIGLFTTLLMVRRRRVANMHIQGLVSRIQAELISKKSSVSPFIPKEHLRERLVNTKINKDSANHWMKAEKIIEDDSRVLVTPQLIRGQQMDCWRWMTDD